MSDSNPFILLVEPDETFAQRIRLDLQEAGYTTIIATDPGNGWHQFQELQPALIMIDHSLTGKGGLNLCRKIRQSGSRIPMILLMTQERVEDRVMCLEVGADDYLIQPYRSETLLQLLRLYLEPTTGENEKLHFGDLTLDLALRQATRNGRIIDLTMKEFELLKYLMSYPRDVLTREKILENVWGYNFVGESNVIEVYIRYLRLKIEDEGEKRLIQTVRGVGYVLRES
jgi:OmpR family response regulator NblR